ncbi:hypothetical protein TNCV_3711031 [Trichonephila clavipes]|uniref:Uncharacterized protein n=1 Tax=Trichonephila clavipes TaxID=2585209 RepID=A0A8X6URJ1_TRICX|nr:hypothetical protein TNCV_3711031 [Trichonephila clavipes]
MVHGIEEVVEVAWQINLDVDSDDVQKLLDARNQELTMGKLIPMHEQDVEEFESSSIRRSNDSWEFDRRHQFN